jgi:hypothetical protein
VNRLLVCSFLPVGLLYVFVTWRCDQPQLNGDVNRRVLSPCCWRHGGERVEGLPITNECVRFDAKFKSSTDCSSLNATLSLPLLHSGASAGGPGAGWGCARGTDRSSHNRGRRLCEIIAKLGSPAQAKRGEIFVSPLVPYPPPSAPNSSLSPIIGQSQSELQPQSPTRQIRLRFHRVVSIEIVPFHFLLIAYHAQRRALPP